MYPVITNAGESEFIWRGVLSSFTFQISANPGLARAAAEIFWSLGTQKDRCASPPTVFHSPAPRPNWARAVPAVTSAVAVSARIAVKYRMGSSYLGVGDWGPG